MVQGTLERLERCSSTVTGRWIRESSRYRTFTSMSYQYDVFISYRRNQETHSWIREHFIPLLTLRLEMELNRQISIYVDDQLEAGTTWPISLGIALGSSRILIALWSGNYLSSPWCVEELSQMLAREHETNLRTYDQPHGIVIPVLIHDGETFPADLGHIQRYEVQKYFNVRMARNSPRAEELDASLTAHAPAIAACIKNAPTWKGQWQRETASKLFSHYQSAELVQSTVPRFTNP